MNKDERKAWLQERKTYIGGSDLGCILGLSKYKSALDIYLDKTTDIIDETTSEAAHWGNVLEDVVAQEYSRITPGWQTASRAVLADLGYHRQLFHRRHPQACWNRLILNSK